MYANHVVRTAKQWTREETGDLPSYLDCSDRAIFRATQLMGEYTDIVSPSPPVCIQMTAPPQALQRSPGLQMAQLLLVRSRMGTGDTETCVTKILL